MGRICVVVPAYNDWESVARLLAALATVSAAYDQRYRILLLDDSSTLSPPEAWPGIVKTSFDFLKIVRRAYNLGRQRVKAQRLREDPDFSRDLEGMMREGMGRLSSLVSPARRAI